MSTVPLTDLQRQKLTISPLRFPDLTADFFLLEMLKLKVYFNNPQMIEELEQNIRDAVAAIFTDIDEATQNNDILTCVFLNFNYVCLCALTVMVTTLR